MAGALLLAAIAVSPPLPVGALWKRQVLRPEFSVEVPVALKAIVTNGDGKKAPKGMDYWLINFGRATYGAMRVPITKEDRKRVTPQVESYSQSMARPQGGRITWQRQVSLPSGIRGLEWDQENRLMRSRWRAFEFKEAIYSAAVTWNRSEQVPPGFQQFLESVRLGPPAKK